MSIMKCLIYGCKKESVLTGNGIGCNIHSYKCIWSKCKRKRKTTWFCKLHYLAKEANYGLNDTDPENKEESKRPGGHFYQWGVERLRDFALYVIDEGII